MKTTNKFAFASLCSLLTFMLTSELYPGPDLSGWLDNAQATVETALAQFNQDNEISHLQAARDALKFPPGNPGNQGWEGFGERWLRLHLKVLLTSYAARDWSYDLKNPPPVFTKVAPPLSSGQMVIAGMDPEEVTDPEARRIYKERIAANEKNKAKYRRAN